jgi:ornithine carrier protein
VPYPFTNTDIHILMEVSEGPVAVVESGGKSLIAHNETSVARKSTQGQQALKDVVCGSVAGIVGKYIEYPFDTVKVRLQSQPDHLPLRYTGPLDCFKQSLKQDGFIGIYRGISAPLVGAAVENACLFFSVSAGRNVVDNLDID